MLDIFDELNPDHRSAWERHVSGCPDCRGEREAIIQTLTIAKTVLEAPPLEETEAADMRKRVIRDLAVHTKSPRERKQPFFFSRAFIPTLATACVLLIALGFIASKFLTGPEIVNSSRLAALQEQLPAEDLDIINNLDLLTNLDALDKLARTIDESQPPSPQNNVQGNYGHGKKTIFS